MSPISLEGLQGWLLSQLYEEGHSLVPLSSGRKSSSRCFDALQGDGFITFRDFFFLSGITKSSWEMSVHLGQKFSHRVFQVWWKSNTRALVRWMEGSLPQTNMPGRGRGSASHGEVLGQNILVSTLGISTWTHENCVWCIVTTAFKIQDQWALPSSQLCVRARLA